MSEPENKSSFRPDPIFWTVVIFAFGLSAWVAIPNRVGSHISPANVCINNLRQIDAAANQFALERALTNGDRINFPNDLTPYIKLNREGKIPSCPSGGIYRGSQNLVTGKPLMNPTCSLSTTVTPAHILR